MWRSVADVANDKDSFREMFSQSIAQKKDLLTYARLRCTSEYYGGSDYTVPHKEILFEIMGYPHFLPGEEECKCFFAVAKPYPSRNTAMYVLLPHRSVFSYIHFIPYLDVFER